MKNNTFLKIITIFVTVSFVLEMVPLQVLALSSADKGYPVGMKAAWDERANSPATWNYICKWGINPSGYEPVIEKGVGKEIFGPTFTDNSSDLDSYSGGYYQDGILSSPTAPTITAYFNVQKHEYQYTEYSLKTTGYLNKVSNKAQQALYPLSYGKPSCCPDRESSQGKSSSDKCKTGTTKECLVTYCLSNSSDCKQTTKTVTSYTYDKIDETKGGTYYSSRIIDLSATPLQAEITTRTVENTRTTIPDGEIVGCGTRQVGTYNHETKTCPVGISVNINTPIKLPDGTTSDLCKMFYNGHTYNFFGSGRDSASCYVWGNVSNKINPWNTHIFVSTASPIQTILTPGSSIKTNQNIANTQTFVKSFTWISSGYVKDTGLWQDTYYLHNGLRSNYLLADGSILDGHYWWHDEKSAFKGWAIIGFIVGWILNIILPGSGFLIFAGLGDLIFIGSLFIPGANISVTLADKSQISLCSVTPVPPVPIEVSQPTISAQKTGCDATNANITLSLTPDSTKTGKVTGYELYRQNADGTGKVLVASETGLSVEQSQSIITKSDEILNNTIYLYSVSLTVTSGAKNIAISTINTGVCVLPLSCSKFSAFPLTIIKPAKSTLSWICTGATNCKITPSVGNVSNSGNEPVQPAKTTKYNLTCDGGISQWITVTVLKPGYCEINPSGDGCE